MLNFHDARFERRVFHARRSGRSPRRSHRTGDFGRAGQCCRNEEFAPRHRAFQELFVAPPHIISEMENRRPLPGPEPTTCCRRPAFNDNRPNTAASGDTASPRRPSRTPRLKPTRHVRDGDAATESGHDRGRYRVPSAPPLDLVFASRAQTGAAISAGRLDFALNGLPGSLAWTATLNAQHGSGPFGPRHNRRREWVREDDSDECCGRRPIQVRSET